MSDGAENSASSAPVLKFLDLGRLGKSAWWRYLLGMLIIVAGYFVFGVFWTVLIVFIASGGNFPDMDNKTGQFAGIDQMLNYVIVNIPSLFLLLFTLMVVAFLHSRPLTTLITTTRFSSQRLGIGFIGWFSLAAIGGFCSWIAEPQSFKFVMPGTPFFAYLPLIFFLTPIQCATEELFFRGYLLQAFGKWISNIWCASAVNGFLFMLPHLFNPEVGAYGLLPMALVYFLMGFLLALVTLKSNSLEMAIGAHMANNLFDAVILNNEVSALSTRSLFVCTKTNTWFDVGELVIFGIILYWMLGKYLSRTNK